MSEQKTLCDLEMVTVDFGRSDATFRLTFRHRSGQETGRIEVHQVEAEQFTAELAAAITAIIAQLNPHNQSSARARTGSEAIETFLADLLARPR